MSFIFPSLIASNLAQISVILSLEKCQTVLFFLFSCILTYLTCSNKSLMTVAFISKLVQSKDVSDALFMGSQVFNLTLLFALPCSDIFFSQRTPVHFAPSLDNTGSSEYLLEPGTMIDPGNNTNQSLSLELRAKKWVTL